ncbi:COP9 signalosome complex subunit 1-like [Carassius auratus]|uniref:COP9 signalosome complex subunit 1-like n=1 Tax=Carassius auratus TaxID=7957 RepID=A0A6P6PJ81_CARAU|nr:COP9 signalosome complex subunit 1-like [Carassius auratus]
MNKMAVSFNTTVAALEDELTQLILEGLINGRIDSHSKILYARDVDQRSTTFEKSLQMGKEFQRRAKAMILRAAVLRNQISRQGNRVPRVMCPRSALHLTIT